jgi:hypothetical protein
MKTLNQNITTVIFLKLVACALLVSLLTILSCSPKDNPKLETDRVRELLTAGTWNIHTVTVDDIDKTSTYAGLTLAFNSTSYFATNGGIVWMATGGWAFADQRGKLITRGDGLSVTIEKVTTTTLVLTLTWTKTTLGSGRISSLSGNHVFTFNK